MFPNATILGPLFWIVLGLIYALMIVGAKVWAEDLKLKMYWWKWLLATVWYVLLSLCIAAAFTLFGEDEPKAGYYFLGVSALVLFILGSVVWRVLSHNRIKEAGSAEK